MPQRKGIVTDDETGTNGSRASFDRRAQSDRRARRATLDGREPLVVYLRPEMIKSLKMIALERDTSASAIVADAVDAWVRKRGGAR